MNRERENRQYRAFEILPGALTYVTLLGAVIFSYLAPSWVAIYIILFDIYWVLKAINTAIHLLSSFFKLKLHAAYDWRKRVEELKDLQNYKQTMRQQILHAETRSKKADLKQELFRLDKINFTNRLLDFRKVYHLVIVATYKESLEILDRSILSVLESDFPKDQIIFVLGTEERDYERAKRNGEILTQRYGKSFLRFEVVMHPDGIPGEAAVKGANLTYAARNMLPVLDELEIGHDQVIVSAFDSDTIVSRNYFSYLTYTFLTAEKPYRTSYQPMPLYNNNIWDAPAITRVVAVANSFWQMVEASRPDRLVTFSSHALTLRALKDVDFWPADIIPDDSRIFWKCFLYYHGDYRTKPLFTNLSFDAMLDETYIKTLVGQYKQKRRWAWGVSEIPYVISHALSDHKIPFWKKFIYIERLIEGHYFWATASIIIAILGWLPLLLGSGKFGNDILAFNLPLLTRSIMQIATAFLIFSVYINMVLLPKKPTQYSSWRTVNMILQWIFVPIVSTIFGSLPAIDAQTRLMLGRYMEFWVTPKTRKAEIKEPAMVFIDDHQS